MPRLKDLAAKRSKRTSQEDRKIKSPDVEDETLPLEPGALPFEPEMHVALKKKGIEINELAPERVKARKC